MLQSRFRVAPLGAAAFTFASSVLTVAVLVVLVAVGLTSLVRELLALILEPSC